MDIICLNLRKATIKDHHQILQRYQRVAVVPDGIIRNPDEITHPHGLV
jgi:hypothetical protein